MLSGARHITLTLCDQVCHEFYASTPGVKSVTVAVSSRMPVSLKPGDHPS